VYDHFVTLWITKFYITRLDLQFTAPKLKIFETQKIPLIAYFLINPNKKFLVIQIFI